MYTVCPRCGAAVVDPGRDFPCPRCGAPVRSVGTGFVADDEGMGALASIQMSGEPGWKAAIIALQQVARLAAVVLFALSLLLCFAALFAGISQVFGGAPGSSLGGVIYIMTPTPLGLFGITGGPLLFYYSFLVAAITASLVYLLWVERRKLRPLAADAVSHFRSPDRRSGLGLVQLPQVFLAVFFFDILWALIVALAGASPHTPAFDTYPDWYLFYTFANASVYEELMARTLLLGVPLLLAYILAYSGVPREPFAPAAPDRATGGAAWGAAPAAAPAPVPPSPSGALPPAPGGMGAPGPQGPATPAPGWMGAPGSPGPSVPATQEAPFVRRQAQTPPRTLLDSLRSRTSHGLWGYFLGGGFKIGPLEAFFITGSALMFGLAHAASWDAWKIVPTFIAGLGFGYLFLKVGIHAAILLHFSFDYLSLGEALVPGFALMEVLLVVLWTIVGAFYFGHYIVQALKWMRNLAFQTKAQGARREAQGVGDGGQGAGNKGQG